MGIEIYKKAFQLKEKNLSAESIVEFKRILESDGDPFNICHRMIAALYYYRLSDHESALPYATTSVSNSPLDEMASICLVHCLFDAGKPDEMEKEIRRFVSAGGTVELFKTFIEENGAKISDFT
jgi:hypothetical protein